jgi:hypothetical protein
VTETGGTRGREAGGRSPHPRDHRLLVSSIVLASVGLVLLVLGAYLLLVRPGFVLLPEDVRFARITPDELRATHGPLFDWMGLVFRSWGAFMMGFGLLVACTAWGPYRRRDPWAWLTLAMGGVVPLSIFLAVNVALGSDFRLLIGLLLLAYVTALLLPIRRFLPGPRRSGAGTGDR